MLPSSNSISFLVFNTQGALCAAPLIFIIPSACYLKLSEEPRTHLDKIMSCVLLPIGALVMIFGFIMAISNPQDCTHGQEMFYCFPDNFSLTNISDSHFQLTTQHSALNTSMFQWVHSLKKFACFHRLVNHRIIFICFSLHVINFHFGIYQDLLSLLFSTM